MTETTPLTFIVLTRNEERNLDTCLKSVAGWAKECFVVDSGSTDGTVKIAGQYNARVIVHPFETHAKQWRWALENLPISTEWILALDADQRLTKELRDEISGMLKDVNGAQENIAGFFVKRRQIFRGRWIKHGGYYPKYLLKLFRRDRVWLNEADLVDHHFRVGGKTARLKNDIIEDNKNESDISVWIDKHNRYASLQALEYLYKTDGVGEPHLKPSFWGSPDERSLWRKRLWNGLPLYFRPAIFFLYRYILRLGFLDGREGFIFHFLQAFWYRLLVDIKLDEMRQNGNTEQATSAESTWTQSRSEEASNKV